jgi:hypothetical protein
VERPGLRRRRVVAEYDLIARLAPHGRWTDERYSEPNSCVLSVKYLTHRYRDRWYCFVRPLYRGCGE